jgi:hypothetical protein
LLLGERGRSRAPRQVKSCVGTGCAHADGKTPEGGGFAASPVLAVALPAGATARRGAGQRLNRG